MFLQHNTLCLKKCTNFETVQFVIMRIDFNDIRLKCSKDSETEFACFSFRVPLVFINFFDFKQDPYIHRTCRTELTMASIFFTKFNTHAILAAAWDESTSILSSSLSQHPHTTLNRINLTQFEMLNKFFQKFLDPDTNLDYPPNTYTSF